jgi:predicted transcriptional regulator
MPITIRIPDDLRDRIDAARPSTQSREAWVRAACEARVESGEEAMSEPERWRWTMTGTAPMSGNIVRDAVETGEVDAEGAGEVVEHIAHHGWWDSFNQQEPVTITVEPIDA